VRYIDSQASTDLLGLVGKQVIVGERVMRNMGHIVPLWEWVRTGPSLLRLGCSQCNQYATINLISPPSGGDYSVLLFPDGACHKR
jgi:hypothetical protein